jgi:YbgC/YbaW family acyl-CoA thioester hydrolase
MPKIFSTKVHVRSYELDWNGHVNNAVFLSYFEHGRVQALAEIGLPWEVMMKKGIFVVVANVTMAFQAPAFLGQELEITVEAVKVGNSSITLKQMVQNRSTDKTCVEGEVVGVFINAAGKPIAVPEEIRKAFMNPI